MPSPEQIVAFVRRLIENPRQGIGLLLVIVVLVLAGAYLSGLGNKVGEIHGQTITSGASIPTDRSSTPPESTDTKPKTIGERFREWQKN